MPPVIWVDAVVPRSVDCACIATSAVRTCPARAASVFTACWAEFARAKVWPTGWTAVKATVYEAFVPPACVPPTPPDGI